MIFIFKIFNIISCFFELVTESEGRIYLMDQEADLKSLISYPLGQRHILSIKLNRQKFSIKNTNNDSYPIVDEFFFLFFFFFFLNFGVHSKKFFFVVKICTGRSDRFCIVYNLVLYT